jgi:hypothetical protein
MLGHPDAAVGPGFRMNRDVEAAARTGVLDNAYEIEDGWWRHSASTKPLA